MGDGGIETEEMSRAHLYDYIIVIFVEARLVAKLPPSAVGNFALSQYGLPFNFDPRPGIPEARAPINRVQVAVPAGTGRRVCGRMCE